MVEQVEGIQNPPETDEGVVVNLFLRSDRFSIRASG